MNILKSPLDSFTCSASCNCNVKCPLWSYYYINLHDSKRVALLYMFWIWWIKDSAYIFHDLKHFRYVLLFCFLLILFNKPYFLPICTDIESTYPLYQAIINLQFILCNITVPLSFKIRQIRITKLLTLSKAKLNVFSFASFLVMLFNPKYVVVVASLVAQQ